jgi:hypothetical protein
MVHIGTRIVFAVHTSLTSASHLSERFANFVERKATSSPSLRDSGNGIIRIRNFARKRHKTPGRIIGKV